MAAGCWLLAAGCWLLGYCVDGAVRIKEQRRFLDYNSFVSDQRSY
jgi:hypothetical protein